MKAAGWTHRTKRKSKDPYLKSQADKYEYGGRDGTTFVDMDQKFRWFNWDEVVKL